MQETATILSDMGRANQVQLDKIGMQLLPFDSCQNKTQAATSFSFDSLGVKGLLSVA